MARRKKGKPFSGKTVRTVPAKGRGGKKRTVPAVFSAPRQNPGIPYFLPAALVLTLAGLFSLPNFHLLLPKDSFLSQVLVHPSLLFVGFVCLVFAFRRIPEAEAPSEMPKGLAYLLFAFFFGLCFFWRFYHPLEPSAPFWFDNMVVTGDIAGIVDSGYHPLLFPWGQREPFFPYLTAVLWKLLPQVGGVWIVRFSCAIIDLLAIWGLYLLGSTIRGRRMGLILMAFWAVSLPMTIWDYFGMGQNTAALAAVWVLLFFYRLVQKPTLARFIYWGAALAFGAYCYVPFRPWTPAMITLVLLWVLFGSKEKPKGTAPWLLAAGLWVSWAFLFFYKNNYLPEKNPLVLLATNPWFLSLLTAGLLAVYVNTWLDREKSETNWQVFGWATGAAVTAILMSPVYLHPLYSQHTTQSSVFMGENGPLPLGQALKMIWHNVMFFFAVMFGQTNEEIGRYPLLGRSYFESFPELCMVIGLAYFTARPSWRKSVVLVMSLVGMSSLVFSNHPHTGRVETAVPPLLLLGAWGLDYFWSLFSRETKDNLVRTGVFLALFGLWAWDAHATFLGIRDWMANKSNDAKIGEQLDKDWRQYRVIIATHYPEFATPSLTVLCDQKEAYALNDPNPIYLEPGQKGKDIVFLMYGSTRYDKAVEDRVRQEFPRAQWSVIEGLNPDVPRLMLRAFIPMDALAETPGKLFYVQRVPHDYWRRRFYWKDYGIGRGIVWWDDRVAALKAPYPPGMNEYITARADGEITVAVDGDYVFSVAPTVETIRLTVDSEKVIDLKPRQDSGLTAGKKVYLKSGIHQVSYVSTFRRMLNFMDIHVAPPGGGKEWILGEPALDSPPKK